MRSIESYFNLQKYSPDERSIVRFVDTNEEDAYVMRRYRETHDINHVLLDQPTNLLGEVVVKVVEALQTRLPMCVLGGSLGSVKLFKKYSFHIIIALR